LVSIIIPVYNKIKLTHACIKSILQNTKYPSYEIIIVNNGSNDDTEEYLDSIKAKLNNIVIINNRTNTGFIKACNQGVQSARGNIVVFLSSNIEVKNGWLINLVNIFHSKEKCAAVGAKVINHDNQLVEAGYSYLKEGSLQGNGIGYPSDHPKYNYVEEIESVSRFCSLFSNKSWIAAGGFDKRFSHLGMAIIDLCYVLRRKGESILYQPLSVVELNSNFKTDNKDNSPLLNPVILNKRRPRIKKIIHFNGRNKERKSKVLVVGVYLASKENNVDDIVTIISRTKLFNVTQRWVALGGEPPTKRVAAVTEEILYKNVPKFKIINNIINQENLDKYEYVLITDDDVIMPIDFLDQYLGLQSEVGFALAQPARTNNSYIDHPIVGQHPGLRARQTRFVEIGPVVSFHKSIYNKIFPFDLTSPMGWGYENVWAYELERYNMTMGIIDNTPVDHSIRRAVENYNWNLVDQQRTNLFNSKKHIKTEECHQVLSVIP
jgi:GT2 family glycosyltransferase